MLSKLEFTVSLFSGDKVWSGIEFWTLPLLTLKGNFFLSLKGKESGIFQTENSKKVFATNYWLVLSFSIPEIEVRPSIDEVQMALVHAGKVILSVSKGVATWRKGTKKKKEDSKTQKVEGGGGAGAVSSAEGNRELK